METDHICYELEMFASLAKQAKSPRARRHAVERLVQSADKILHPVFNEKKLKRALNAACIEKPDFGDPVVFESNKDKLLVHLNGTFDLDVLSTRYFAQEWETIDVR